MFSVAQKRDIAEKVQAVLRETGHPELPEGEIQFQLHVEGAEGWSWADIRNNGAVENPEATANPHNEVAAAVQANAEPPLNLANGREVFHRLWTKAVGTPGYVKEQWSALERFVKG